MFHWGQHRATRRGEQLPKGEELPSAFQLRVEHTGSNASGGGRHTQNRMEALILLLPFREGCRPPFQLRVEQSGSNPSCGGRQAHHRMKTLMPPLPFRDVKSVGNKGSRCLSFLSPNDCTFFENALGFEQPRLIRQPAQLHRGLHF